MRLLLYNARDEGSSGRVAIPIHLHEWRRPGNGFRGRMHSGVEGAQRNRQTRGNRSRCLQAWKSSVQVIFTCARKRGEKIGKVRVGGHAVEVMRGEAFL